MKLRLNVLSVGSRKAQASGERRGFPVQARCEPAEQQGPVGAAPSADYVWIPGHWVWWHEHYAWRPGFWAAANPDWIWMPAHYRGDLERQISQAIVRLNQSKKQHPILICDEAQLLRHPALEQLPLLLNFDMDSSRYLTLLLVGQPLLRRTLSLQMHEALRQRIAVQYHLEGLSREELEAYLAQQLKAAGVTQPLFDDTARQALYQASKGILRKVNKLALTALRLAASRKAALVDETILLDATTEALL